MDAWEAIRFGHLLAMAFFVGGQLVLVAAVVPAARGTEQMRRIARAFGVGSVVAIAFLVATGVALAEHLDRWSDSALHAKLALVVAIGALIAAHIRHPERRWLDGLVFALSLVVVWLGVAIAH